MKMQLIFQHPWVFGSATLVMMAIFSIPTHAMILSYKTILYGTPRLRGRILGYHYMEILDLGPKFPDPPKVFDGMAVIADPEDGCQSIAPPPNATGINPSGNWIAVVKNGNCHFTVKIRNAQNAGYNMVLMDNGEITIYNEVIDSDTRSKNSDIKIYTIFTSVDDVNFIKEKATYDKKMILNIIKDDDDPIVCTYSRGKHGKLGCYGLMTKKEYPIVPDTRSRRFHSDKF